MDNQPKILFEPVPAHLDFEELIATADDPENEHMYYAYLRSKCGRIYKCDVTWQHTSSVFGIVRWNTFSEAEVLVEGMSLPPENWRWNHELIDGKTRKDNHKFLKDIVDWCLNRVHKLSAPKFKPGWRIQHEEAIQSATNIMLMENASSSPLVEHGLCRPDTAGESLPPNPDDSPSRQDGGLPPVDGQPGATEDVHESSEIGCHPAAKGHGSHS